MFLSQKLINNFIFSNNHHCIHNSTKTISRPRRREYRQIVTSTTIRQYSCRLQRLIVKWWYIVKYKTGWFLYPIVVNQNYLSLPSPFIFCNIFYSSKSFPLLRGSHSQDSPTGPLFLSVSKLNCQPSWNMYLSGIFRSSVV